MVAVTAVIAKMVVMVDGGSGGGEGDSDSGGGGDLVIVSLRNIMTNEGAIATPYDVFLSYSSDTRDHFAANLYNALRDKRIKTFFRDDERPRSGNQLTSPSILNALEKSIISIVVLSKSYARSMRCLAQLVKIIDCMKSRGQLVWPIFYGVDPSDVRHQRGSYAQAMVEHENMFKDDHKKVLEWRSALSEVANLLDDRWLLVIGKRYESELIQKVVERVAQRTPSYDVFLSFSEKDSRYSFTSFLYNALEQEGFKTLMNDEGLEDGDQIPLSIMKAIERSKFFIIVLSENYAYSSSRLDQLVRILDSRKMTNQLVGRGLEESAEMEVSFETRGQLERMVLENQVP
ncbi:disease resistance protein RRS1B-like [Gastrolobium bilobum]|uniref:disease resistance protein RRS1B-like n=1 Tax=Gastrolobium bilobum TaxID=150636 RepID=UPI002AB10329|nr:disease resistance protein RRS1B-like [Gastrolobium bilobum]